MNTKFVIIGAGLSGLYAAYRLKNQGTNDFVVLESRPRSGGRIASAFDLGIDAKQPAYSTLLSAKSLQTFDLGPTWFWPNYQPELQHTLLELGLESFEQHSSGDVLMEYGAGQAPQRLPGGASTSGSYRLKNGMSGLIAKLESRLDAQQIQLGQKVREVRLQQGQLEVDTLSDDGQHTTWDAQHVLLALPPRLAMQEIKFTPGLPKGIEQQWQHVDTWMAPHAKYLAIYETPFWRDSGLSGTARSQVGPLVEIHDASMPDGHAALFGFIGVSARSRRTIPQDAFKNMIRGQLSRLFGEQAKQPVLDFIKDWSTDPMTATEMDLNSGGFHNAAPPAYVKEGAWQTHLTGIASEWSEQYPGYVAGAIDAANQGVHRITSLY